MGPRVVLSVGVLVGLVLSAPGGASAQQSSCPTPGEGSGAVLHVRGAVQEPLTLSAPELDRLPRERVRVEERDGSVAEYEGVSLVDRKNGAPLSAEEGPFRVVMEGERRHSRWIRQVVCLRVERL